MFREMKELVTFGKRSEISLIWNLYIIKYGDITNSLWYCIEGGLKIATLRISTISRGTCRFQ